MEKQDIPTWVKVAIAVVVFAITIGTTAGGIAWAMSRDSTSHDYVVDSLLKTDLRHDQLILQNTENITLVEKNQHKAEIARTELKGTMNVFIAGQQATTKELTELKAEFTDLAKYLKQFDYDKKKEAD